MLDAANNHYSLYDKEKMYEVCLKSVFKGTWNRCISTVDVFELLVTFVTFGALTLLDGSQEVHLAC